MRVIDGDRLGLVGPCGGELLVDRLVDEVANPERMWEIDGAGEQRRMPLVE